MKDGGFADRWLPSHSGTPVEPSTTDWLDYVRCTACGRVYDHVGIRGQRAGEAALLRLFPAALSESPDVSRSNAARLVSSR